jgi:hypothetical protein
MNHAFAPKATAYPRGDPLMLIHPSPLKSCTFAIVALLGLAACSDKVAGTVTPVSALATPTASPSPSPAAFGFAFKVKP